MNGHRQSIFIIVAPLQRVRLTAVVGKIDNHLWNVVVAPVSDDAETPSNKELLNYVSNFLSSTLPQIVEIQIKEVCYCD